MDQQTAELLAPLSGAMTSTDHSASEERSSQANFDGALVAPIGSYTLVTTTLNRPARSAQNLLVFVT